MMGRKEKEILVFCLCVWQLFAASTVSGYAVFKVEHKFKGGKRALKELRDHDFNRHGRLLANIDLPLGGDSSPTNSGLYFTKVRIGNPAKDYYVQVDTGSDIMWVHCRGCEGCPKESRIKNIEMQAYDPKSSSSAKVINCGNKQCSTIYQHIPPSCQPDMLCQFEVNYGDGSATSGYFVEDSMNYTMSENQYGTGSITFGCGTKAGESAAPLLVDGIIGFGQANSSVISQLAASGKVKKKFSHCLDNNRGGGILAVGELVEPKLNSSPMMENQPHYNIVLDSIDVDGEVKKFSPTLFTSERGAIIDSGTTLAYLPGDIYDMILKKIVARQPNLQFKTVQGSFKCFDYSGEIDDDFPKVVMNFKGSLSLTTYPHEYFFPLDGDTWCIGWQSSSFKSRDGMDVILIGDMLLQNRLVYYDLEHQTIGWTEYNCTSSIKLKDEGSGKVQVVGAQTLTSAANSFKYWTTFLLPLLLLLINLAFTLPH